VTHHNPSLRKQAERLLAAIREGRSEEMATIIVDQCLQAAYDEGFTEGYGEGITYADRSRIE
jgi:hypothetical protein